MCLFSFRKHFCDLFLLFFFYYYFLEVVREKRGGQGEDAWSFGEHNSSPHEMSVT